MVRTKSWNEPMKLEGESIESTSPRSRNSIITLNNDVQKVTLSSVCYFSLINSKIYE